MSPWPAPERDLWRPRAGVLSAAELQRALGDHPAWHLDGERLVRELQFRDFGDAFRFVERLAGEVEDFDRHPDICLVDGNRVRVAVANPNRMGVTVAELRLVGKVDASWTTTCPLRGGLRRPARCPRTHISGRSKPEGPRPA
jgi:4a-hydroxytetrahydrobiopterin dehydratase